MLDKKNLRTERFIQMVKEAIELRKSYPDFGKIIIVLDDEERINGILGNDSEISKPNFLLFNHFVDRFNQEIYPKYLEFEKIYFRYFGEIKFQNKMTAFMTQVLVELRAYAKNKHDELSTTNIPSTNPSETFSSITKMMFKFENLLHSHMDELILKYIKNYDSEITNLSEFELKYPNIDSYMRHMVSKVIENIE